MSELQMDKIPVTPAKWFTKVTGPARDIRLIVLHSMEAPEKGTTAESVAKYFAGGSGGRKASAHYCIDDDSIIQCVDCADVAYAAPNANSVGIHLELAGYARQSREEWLDAFGTAMLRNAARLCAEVLIPKYGIPVTFPVLFS
jgi:N-acetyl-anhydromuramyl-L-alanine amidase AmpD